MLCGASVYRVGVQGPAGALTYTASPLVGFALGAGTVVDAIDAHDVTGDTLDDLLVLATDPDGLRRVHVLPQLTSREVSQ